MPAILSRDFAAQVLQQIT